MRAIVVDKPFEMRIADVDMPSIKDDEVLIKVISVSCNNHKERAGRKRIKA